MKPSPFFVLGYVGFFHRMNSYGLSLWLAGAALESLILARALIVGWFRKYPFFFGYLASVFLQDIILLLVYIHKFKYYRPAYWFAEFLSLLMGCALTWEIFRLVLGRYPGAGRMARNVLFLLLILVSSRDLVGVWNGGVPWAGTFLETERNLRGIQAISLIVLALLIAYYRVPLLRHAKGIFAGYGIFIASIVMTLTLRASIGQSFQTAWTFLQPLSFAAALSIWCVSLWNDEPVLVEVSSPKIEQDYQALALLTRKVLLEARGYLNKAMRS